MNNASMKAPIIVRIIVCLLLVLTVISEDPAAPAVLATALPVPTQLTAMDAGDGMSIDLHWTNPDSGSLIAGFIVYRSQDDLNFFAIGETPVAQTSYRDSGLTANTRYYYRIASKDADGGTSTPSASVYAEPTTVDNPPGVPAGLTGQKQSSGYLLSWQPNAEADLAGYRLYRSEDSINYFKVQNDLITATQFADTGIEREKQYEYRISAVDLAGQESPLSSPIATEIEAYVSESNVIRNSHFQSDLSDWMWGAYQLYRDEDDEQTKWDEAQIAADGAGYTGTIRNAGHDIAGAGKAVKLELAGAGHKARTTLYQRKLDIVPTGSPVQLSFAWKKNCGCIADPGTKQVLRVEIVRPDASWATVWEDASISAMSAYALVENLDITSFVNLTGTYDIRFIAEQWTAAGDASAVNTIRLDEIFLDLPHGPETPKGLQVNVAKEGGALQISWLPNSESQADGYNLYRSLQETGPFVLLNTGSITGSSYEDKGLSNGQTYYYQVKAVAAGVESVASRAVRGTPTFIDPLLHPHHTFADNTDACATCHVNHKGKSKSKTLLKESGETKLCMTCHNGTGSKYNTQGQFTVNDLSFHPVKGTPNSPDGSMECSSCHNPHATNGKRTTPREAVGSLANVAGVDPQYSTVPFTNPIGFTVKAVVQKESQLCLTCHSTNPQAPVTTQTTAVAKEFHPDNISGHNSVSDSKSSGFGLYVNGWTASSVTSCTDCHGAPSSPDQHQGVHGSLFTHLLKKEYTNRTKADTDQDALCFTCHDRSSYGGNPAKDTSFMTVGQTRFLTKPIAGAGTLSTGTNLHNYWNQTLGKGHLGLACAQCHSAVPHGTGKLPAMLVDLSDPQPYQTYTEDTNLKIFYPADGDWSNKNSCATPGSGCHMNVK